MKILLFAALIVLASCSKLPVEPERDGYPELRFLKVENNEWGNPVYKFQLIKDGDEGELYYSAYSVESPIYDIKVKTEGGWKDEFLGWCGTGLDYINLKDLQTITEIHINPFDKNQQWKAGIRFYKKVNGEIDWQNGVTIWSNVVPAK